MRKKIFCLTLLIIYILFLSKDSIIYGFRKLDNTYYQSLEENYYKREYENLARMVDITSEFDIKVAKVVVRDIYEFYDKVLINKGIDEGVEEKEVVINEKGVVGITQNSNKHSSEVKLLTNKDINLSVKINDSYGILSSQNNKLLVKNIKKNSNIQAGDKVYTSGLTNIKEGLYVGEVVNIGEEEAGLEYYLEVKSGVDFYNIKYVGVIK